MKDANCPYCDAEIDINHDDGYGVEENENHQQTCDKCNKTFVYTTQISFYYETFEAECLNDGKHNWTPTHTFPKEYTKMKCETCGEYRNPTPEELKEILNPSR